MIKFKVDDIIQPLSIVASIISNKTTIPIFDKILFENDGNKINLIASDCESLISIECGIIESDKNESFCVDGYIILRTLKNLLGLTVSVEIVNNQLVGRYGKNGEFKLPVVDGSEFIRNDSSFEESKCLVFEIDSKKMLRAIKYTEFAVASDELRPILNGIHFLIKKECLECASSDGYKLIMFDDFSIKAESDDAINSFTLPKKPAKLISSILESQSCDIMLKIYDKSIVINGTDFKICTKCIDGNIPNFRSVIPNERNFKAKVKKSDMLNVLKRILPLGDSSNELIIATFKSNELKIMSESVDWSTSGTESIECDYDYNDAIKIGFKGTLLIQTIQNINDEDINIELVDGTRACVFTPLKQEENTDYLSLLMPMHL